jgi:hypothetical protein
MSLDGNKQFTSQVKRLKKGLGDGVLIFLFLHPKTGQGQGIIKDS